MWLSSWSRGCHLQALAVPLISLANLGDSDLAYHMADPRRCLRPSEELPERLTPTRVHVDSDDEWSAVACLMIERKVARVVLD